ncbi:MAG: hypothetical protein OXE95_06685 [Chloroflexi bacterium]|nr:hypothetical protein [Chloroflexota bacterium]MCY4247245.1 hypothetical protein [Chloroflexota bacterium]
MLKIKAVARKSLLLCLFALLTLPMTASADEDSLFASIRLYDGIDPADQSEIARRVAEGFLPIMRESEGFVGYYLLPADDKLAAVSLFESPEQAAASNEAARDFVAENLAPLLPNPPTAHEGAVGLNVRGDMMRGLPSSLYASLRVYADFDMTRFDESTEQAKSELVPELLAIDGFFAQYSVATTGSVVVAISIYDSPAAAEANSNAVDFSRGQVAPRSPQVPTGFSSSLAVAALADTADGANLIAREIFASVRVYDGVDPTDRAEIQQLTVEGFLPIMRSSAGFVGYYWMQADDMLAAISLFEMPEQAAAATEAASAFVAETVAMLLPNPPTVVEGAVDVYYAMNEQDILSQSLPSLYAALRLYDNYDLSDRDEAAALVERIFVPQQQEAGGLFSYFTMNDGIDRVAALTVYESAEKALVANTLAAEFVAEYLPGQVTEEPVRINAELGIAALADVGMGANLVVPMGG